MTRVGVDMELNIDKTNWIRISLGDVVEESRKVVRDPVKEGIDKVVGLEHIDSESIHLRRWETLELGTTFTKEFTKGQVLFGRRRAYLKKVALAPFDGICSGDITVLEAKKDLLPQLLPFLINNDKFFDFAIKNSAGSLSPRAKFKDLANYEFLLPPKDQQTRLAELLWAADEVVENDKILIESLNYSQTSIFKNSIYRESASTDKYFGHLAAKYPVNRLGDLVQELQYGISESMEDVSGIPILRMNNLQDGKLLLDDLKYYKPNGNELERFMLNKGDLLFNRTNSFELVGKVSLFNEDSKYSFASYLIRIIVDRAKLDPRYLNFFLNSPIGMGKIRNHRTPGVSQSNINAQNLKLVPIPVPPIDLQLDLMDRVEQIDVAQGNLKMRLTTTKQLQKALINQIF